MKRELVMGHRYPQPDNEDDFEQLCLRHYRKIWENGSLQLYAKRGEKQDGVDIFDPLLIPPVRAIQCKFHESHKTIPPKEIKDEVTKAEQSSLPIERYIIATTAKKSKKAQDTVVELNQRNPKTFTTEIHFWEDICQEAGQLGPIVAELIIYGQNILAGATDTQFLHECAKVAIVASEDGSSSEIFDEVLAEIERLIDERHFEAARHELSKQPDLEEARNLDQSLSYFLFRCHARLEMASGNWEEASRLFLEAFEFAPELDQAKQNRVLAYSLSGQREMAYKLAKGYIDSGLDTAVMVERLVDATTSLDQLAENCDFIDKYRDENENLNVLLCHKYLILKHPDSAFEVAQKAVKISADSPHANLALGFAAHSISETVQWGDRLASLQLAEKHYTLAESQAKEQNYPLMMPEIFINRGGVRMFLSKTKQASEDYKAAAKYLGRPSEYACRSVSFFLQERDYETAWEMLEFLDLKDLEAQYLTTVTEYENGSEDEKEFCRVRIEELANEDFEHKIDCRCFAVQWAINRREFDEALRLVPEQFVNSHPFIGHTLRAWILHYEDDTKAVNHEVSMALESSLATARPQDLRLLTNLLLELGHHENALPLLEQIVIPGVLNEEMKRLLECSQKLRRDGLTIRLCAELREAGSADLLVQKIELQFLAKYDPRQAFELVSRLSNESPEQKYFNAFRNFLIVRLELPHELVLAPGKLPSPGELRPEESYLVIRPYVHSKLFDHALEFLYGQRREFFECELAHSIYIFFFLHHERFFRCLEPDQVVMEGDAVRGQVNSKEPYWVTIEGDRPRAFLGEIASDSELAKGLLSCKVNAKVVLPSNDFQEQTVKAVDIQTKFVRVFQDSVEKFKQRFPDSSVIQQFVTGEGDEFDPSPIIRSLEARRNHVRKCIEGYRDCQWTLHLLSERLGVNLLDTIQALNGQVDTGVKCSQITRIGFERAVENGNYLNSIVIDLSAIVTLTLCDAWSFLDENRNYLVSRTTKELVVQWSEEIKNRSGENNVALLDESGQLFIRESTEDERQKRLNHFGEMRSMIDSLCVCESSLAVAQLEPTKREQYFRLIGENSIESICLAIEHDAGLLTDDVVVGFIGQTDFGISHVWTQSLLGTFKSVSVTDDQFEQVSAQLLGWNYTAIVWSEKTLLAAAEQADWLSDNWPLRQSFDLLAKSNDHDSAKARIALGFIVLMRRQSCSELKQGAVIHNLLNALASRNAVLWIRRQVETVFRLDVDSMSFVAMSLDYWLEKH